MKNNKDWREYRGVLIPLVKTYSEHHDGLVEVSVDKHESDPRIAPQYDHYFTSVGYKNLERRFLVCINETWYCPFQDNKSVPIEVILAQYSKLGKAL